MLPFSFFEIFGEITFRIELLNYALKASRVNEVKYSEVKKSD
jgi:hypothetical protein